jgi:ribosomal protein S21
VASNVKVTLRRGETTEKLIRRFNRRCKKDRIVEIYRQKTDHYVKPSIKKRMKREAAQREQKKLQRKKDNKLFR